MRLHIYGRMSDRKQSAAAVKLEALDVEPAPTPCEGTHVRMHTWPLALQIVHAMRSFHTCTDLLMPQAPAHWSAHRQLAQSW